MDIKNLSKIKNIFHIYTSPCDNYSKLHFEKFPIIYINKNVVFYKNSRHDIPNEIALSSVKEDFVEYLNNYNKMLENKKYFGHWFTYFCFDIDQVYAQNLYTEYYMTYNSEDIEKRKKSLKEEYIKTIKQMKYILKEADKVWY